MAPEKSQQILKSYQEKLEKLLAIPDLEESQRYELNLHWVLVSTQWTQKSEPRGNRPFAFHFQIP